MEDDEDITHWDKDYEICEEDKVYYGSDSTSFNSSDSEDYDFSPEEAARLE